MHRQCFFFFATSSKYSWVSGITFKLKNRYRGIDFLETSVGLPASANVISFKNDFQEEFAGTDWI